MRRIALALAITGSLGLATIAAPAMAMIETPEAKAAAADAAADAHADMVATFGVDELRPGQYLWDDEAGASDAGEARVVISLSNQIAYLYRGYRLAAVTSISSGTPKNPTPTGIFGVLDKKTFHRSVKYDNAPMPHMQRIDKFGVALHAGMNPGHPASHGCIRLPAKFAAKLFTVTKVGTPVMIGA